MGLQRLCETLETLKDNKEEKTPDKKVWRKNAQW
jgi:hypothetical protein